MACVKILLEQAEHSVKKQCFGGIYALFGMYVPAHATLFLLHQHVNNTAACMAV